MVGIEQAVKGYNPNSNGSHLSPTWTDHLLFIPRLCRGLYSLVSSGNFGHLRAVAAEVRGGRLSQHTYDKQFIPVREYLDRRVAHETGNLKSNGKLLVSIVTGQEFANYYHTVLPHSTVRLWDIGAELSDTGKECYSFKDRMDHAGYADGRNAVRDHPRLGAALLWLAGFPRPRPARWEKVGIADFDPRLVTTAALYHQEKFGGNGYPRQWQQRQIPVAVRWVKFADAVVAMHDRKGMRLPKIIAELERCRGVDFDPEVLDIGTPFVEDFYRDKRVPAGNAQR